MKTTVVCRSKIINVIYSAHLGSLQVMKARSSRSVETVFWWSRPRTCRSWSRYQPYRSRNFNLKNRLIQSSQIKGQRFRRKSKDYAMNSYLQIRCCMHTIALKNSLIEILVDISFQHLILLLLALSSSHSSEHCSPSNITESAIYNVQTII
jgi:hypothetical protein